MSTFEKLLDSLVPGTGRQPHSAPAPAQTEQGGASGTEIDAPLFPTGLGLEPRGVLARGGSGWVFRAFDPVLQREVAVKISRKDLGSEGQQAMLDEARRAARLDHPSVLPVHRVAVTAGRVCVEYRLAPSTSLEALIADREALEERDIPGRLVLLRGPVRALHRAHSLGLVHGDIHPGNLLLGPEETVYLLDWAGPVATAGTLSGSPALAAPEVLRGGPHTVAADVFSMGAVAWELCMGRPLRPRQRGEELGAFVARWRDLPVPTLAPELQVPPGVRELLAATLDPDPDQRIDAATLAELLDDALSGAAERVGRHQRGSASLTLARDSLARYRELGRHLVDERTVVAVQRARVPGYAPPAAKRALWEAEDRLLVLEEQRGVVWLEAMEHAVLAGALGEDDTEARTMVGELWWVRMEDQSARGQDQEVRLAAHQVMKADPERRGSILRAPCHLNLQLAGPAASRGDETTTIEAAALRSQGRRLRPQAPAVVATPGQELELPPGRWEITVRAAGYVPLIYPLHLERGQRHSAVVRPRTAEEIGPGWVLVPAGHFVLGGDPQAREPLPRCRPTVDDFYIQQTPVTCGDWLKWLQALPPHQAALRAPGGRGPLGPEASWWSVGKGERFALPAHWDPDWPVVGIDAEDAAAYAAWASQQWGRPVRLPGEEEWEKAARGVDGRSYPWGNLFDPTFAHMRSSRPGTPGLASVTAFPVDRSPYGCLSMAGGVREWTASWRGMDQVVVRGGCWEDDAHDLRCASRRAMPPRWRSAHVGLRLVSDIPAEPSP